MNQITFQQWYDQLDPLDHLILDNVCDTPEELHQALSDMYDVFIALGLELL